MAVGTGIQSYAMLGEESVYGTTVARDIGLLFNSESLRAEEIFAVADDLYRRGRHKGTVAQGRIETGGDINFNPRYGNRGFTRLLKHALGSVSSVQPDITTNPLAYRHTFTPADALPKGLDIEIAKGIHSHLHSGCKVASLRLSFSAGEKMTASATFVGREQTVVASPTSLSLVAGEGNLIVANNASLTWNGATVSRVISGEVSIENPIDRIFDISSRYTLEPENSGKRRISGNFVFQVQDDVIYNDYRNNNRRALVLTITGATISGAYAYDLVFTIAVAELRDAIQSADSPGVLTATAAFECYLDDANASEVSIRVTNGNSAA